MDLAATLNTVDVNSPAILNILGSIRRSPCEDVNVVVKAPVCKAPCTAPEAPPSLCISVTMGTSFQIFFSPFTDQVSDHSPIFDDGVIG